MLSASLSELSINLLHDTEWPTVYFFIPFLHIKKFSRLKTRANLHPALCIPLIRQASFAGGIPLCAIVTFLTEKPSNLCVARRLRYAAGKNYCSPW
jgi:hypothetical protein